MIQQNIEEIVGMVTIGILIFPQVEELDLVGQFEVLSYVNKIRLWCKKTQPKP